MLIVGDVVARKKSIDPSLRLITMRLVSSRAVVQPLRTRDHSRSIDQLISRCGGGDVHSRSDSDETQQRSPDHFVSPPDCRFQPTPCGLRGRAVRWVSLGGSSMLKQMMNTGSAMPHFQV